MFVAALRNGSHLIYPGDANWAAYDLQIEHRCGSHYNEICRQN